MNNIKNKNIINNNISSSEESIRLCQRSIKDLNSQIEELVLIKRKIQSYQQDFANNEKRRMSRLANESMEKNNLKCMTMYISGMKAFLGGTDYKSAYNGLTSALERINRQISQLNKEIEGYNRQITVQKSKIIQYRNQLRDLRAEV